MPRSTASPPLPGDPALPKTGDKQLPPLPSAVASRPAPAMPPTSATPPRPAPPATPAALSPSPTPAVPSPPAPGPLLGAPKVTAQSDFPFTWYLRIVEGRVREKWNPRAGGANRPLIVFEIDQKGRLVKIVIQRSSGNETFDRGARDAISAAEPFPPLPPEFKEPLLRVHLEFERT
jgi:TonB family protein